MSSSQNDLIDMTYSWKCDWLHWRGKPNKRYIVTNCVNLCGSGFWNILWIASGNSQPLKWKCLHHWQNYTAKPYVKWNWLHWQNHREQKGERESGKFSRKEKLLVGHVCVCCLKPHGAAQNAPLVSNNVGNNCSYSWYTTCLSSIHFHCSLWFIFSTVKLSTDYVKEEVDLPGGNAKIPDEKIMKIAIISHCIYMHSTLIYQNKLTHGLLTV